MRTDCILNYTTSHQFTQGLACVASRQFAGIWGVRCAIDRLVFTNRVPRPPLKFLMRYCWW